MDFCQRKILEDESDLWEFRLDSFENFKHFTAVRAFEVAEFHRCNLRTCRTLGRESFSMKFGEIISEGVAIHVPDLATEHIVTIFSDIDYACFRLALAIRHFHGNREGIRHL